MRPVIIGVIGGKSEPAEKDPRRTTVSDDSRAIGRAVARAGHVLLTGRRPEARTPYRNTAEAPDAAVHGALSANGAIRMIAVPPLSDQHRSFFIETISRGWWPLSPKAYRLVLASALNSAQRDPINALVPDALIVLAGGPGTICEAAFAALAKKPLIFFRASRAQLRDRLRTMKPHDLSIIEQAAAAYRCVCEVENGCATPVALLGALDAELVRDADLVESADQAVELAVAAVSSEHLAKPPRFPGIPHRNLRSISDFDRSFQELVLRT